MQDSQFGSHGMSSNVMSLAGFPGIGMPVLASRGVNEGKLSLERLANLTSSNAAKIFSLAPSKGTISVGADADIAILDMKLERKVSSEIFGGFSDYNVYEGWNLKLGGVASKNNLLYHLHHGSQHLMQIA